MDVDNNNQLASQAKQHYKKVESALWNFSSSMVDVSIHSHIDLRLSYHWNKNKKDKILGTFLKYMEEYDFILEMVLLSVSFKRGKVFYDELNFIYHVREHASLLTEICEQESIYNFFKLQYRGEYFDLNFDAMSPRELRLIEEQAIKLTQNHARMFAGLASWDIPSLDGLYSNIREETLKIADIFVGLHEDKSALEICTVTFDSLLVEKWKQDVLIGAQFFHDPNKIIFNIHQYGFSNYISNRNQFENAVVYIKADNKSGTGVIATTTGQIITANHVIKGASKITVKAQSIADGVELFPASILRQNERQDLAIIQLESKHFFYYAEFDNREKTTLGEEVVIYGFPFGTGISDNIMSLGISFAKGYVSSNQIIKGNARTTLDISAKAGNSGSPIVSLETGKVVGVFSGSYVQENEIKEEINYMIPSSYLFNWQTDIF